MRIEVCIPVLCIFLKTTGLTAETVPARGDIDSRVRTAAYSSDEVYKLHGYAGYQIDLQFESGETFVGMGAGDIEALMFVARDNHLFLKPKAEKVSTNITVVTSRRHYQFDYTATARRPLGEGEDVIYALRFIYPPAPAAGETAAVRIGNRLGDAGAARPRNMDYWYCGRSALKPTAAWDDGVQTRFTFAARGELPAIFVRNDDGSESLLNFHVEDSDIVVHRIAPRFIVRRGNLKGCVVNKGFAGAGDRLKSGTVAIDVERITQGVQP